MTSVNHTPEPSYRCAIVTASAAMLAISSGLMVNGLSAFVVPLNQAFGQQRSAVSPIDVAGLVGLAGNGIVLGRIVMVFAWPGHGVGGDQG